METTKDEVGWPQAEVHEAIGLLTRLSLIEPDVPGTHRIHRLLAQVVRAQLAEAGAGPDRVSTCCDLLAARVPYATDNPAHWPDYARLYSHAFRMADHSLLGIKAAQLLKDLAAYERTRLGALADAFVHGSQAFDLYRTDLGEKHPDTLISRNNLARTLRDQDDLASARAHQEEVVEISRRSLGDEHPDTLRFRMVLDEPSF